MSTYSLNDIGHGYNATPGCSQNVVSIDASDVVNLSGELEVNGDIKGDNLFLGDEGTTPKIDLFFKDSPARPGVDIFQYRIEVGKSDDFINSPAFPPNDAYGMNVQANSDALFVGIETYDSGSNWRPLLKWGDDSTDTPFTIQSYSGNHKWEFRTDGTLSAQTVRIEDDTTQTLTFYDTGGGITKEHARIEVDDNGGGADMIFYTRPSSGNPPTEKLRINKSGAIGIGINNPRARLDVVGGGGVWITNQNGGVTHFNLNNQSLNYIRGHLEVTNSTSINIMGGQDGGTGRGLYFWSIGDTNWAQYMGQSGTGRSFSGGSATGGYGFGSYAMRFRVAFTTNYTTGWVFEDSNELLMFSVRSGDGLAYFRGPVFSYNNYLTSDDRIKFNEKSLTDGLEVIRQLVPQEYMKSKKIDVEEDLEKEIGLIAQEVKEIPQLEHTVVGQPDNPEGLLNVNYTQIFVYGLQAIKELDVIVSKQQETINSLDVIVKKQQETINGLDVIVSKQQETINALMARVEALENK